MNWELEDLARRNTRFFGVYADLLSNSVDRKLLRSLKNGSLRYSFSGKYTKFQIQRLNQR
ncbi:hypothetical protein [Nostoc sp.]